MKKSLLVIIFLSIIIPTILGQIKTNGPINFICNGKYFSINSEKWIDSIQTCNGNKYDIYDNSNNFIEIPQIDFSIIEKIKISIKERSGSDFYCRLILENVLIAKRPKKCDERNYTLRYILPIDSVYFYRFSLTYDSKGTLVSKQMFPDSSETNNMIPTIHYCQAIEKALKDSIFYKAYFYSGDMRSMIDAKSGEWIKISNIPKIELCFDIDNNIWTWIIYTDTKFHELKIEQVSTIEVNSGKKITINAENNKIIKIEDYFQKKIVSR